MVVGVHSTFPKVRHENTVTEQSWNKISIALFCHIVFKKENDCKVLYSLHMPRTGFPGHSL